MGISYPKCEAYQRSCKKVDTIQVIGPRRVAGEQGYGSDSMPVAQHALCKAFAIPQRLPTAKTPIRPVFRVSSESSGWSLRG